MNSDKLDVGELEIRIEGLLSQARNLPEERREPLMIETRKLCEQYRTLTGKLYVSPSAEYQTE